MQPNVTEIRQPMTAGNKDRPLSIAAVADLVGVSAHTLRKWESRHGIGVPRRSASGRRVYGMQEVKLLQSVKQLLDHGHALSHLADLEPEELARLVAEHETREAADSLSSVDLVGPNVAHQLDGWGKVNPKVRSTDENAWLSKPPPADASQALVLETNTLPGHVIDALIELRASHYRRIVVIARMTSRRTRRHLRRNGITAIDTQMPTQTLLALLDQSCEPEVQAQAGQQKFTVEQLAAVAAMTPSLDCECPNHIAQLLIDITAFEQYCKECKDTDPKEAELHAHLSDVTGQARSIFEGALIAVAEADNLDLGNLPSPRQS